MDEEQSSEKAISSPDCESSKQTTNSSPKLQCKKSKKTKKTKRPDGVMGKKKRKTPSTSPKSGPTRQAAETLHAEDKSGYYRSIAFGKPAMEDTLPEEIQEIQDVLTMDDDHQPNLDLPLDEYETEGLPSAVDYSGYKYDGNDGDSNGGNNGDDCEAYGRASSIECDDDEIDLMSEPSEADFKVASELSRVEYYDVETGVGVNPRSAAAYVLAKIDAKRQNRKHGCLLIGVGVLTVLLLLLAGAVAGLSVGRSKPSFPQDMTSPELPDVSAKSVEVPEFAMGKVSGPKFLRFEDGKWVPVNLN